MAADRQPGGAPAADVVIVGAGAAGVATAIFARRANPARSVLLLEGARRPGAKILVSGGGRCNVTNRDVSERDFWGGRRAIIRRILKAFTSADAVEFFSGLGVTLHEENDGKLFPDSGRARDVLSALLKAAETAGVRCVAGNRVLSVERCSGGLRLFTPGGTIHTGLAVLATGGQSLPKSGSNGAGFDFARRLGHTIVPTTPALVPLLLAEGRTHSIHRELSGVSIDAELAIRVDGRISERLSGSLLWTHFGISGPLALNASRHWLRAEAEGRPVRLTANFSPGRTFDAEERWWLETTNGRPRMSALTALAGRFPAALAAAIVRCINIDGARQLAHLTRADRKRLTSAVIEWPLEVAGCRGYNYAEATAGGVALDEIDPATMASRICPGLYLVGEMLDVDGRIGGFNFQWAWSTGFVAGTALAGRTLV